MSVAFLYCFTLFLQLYLLYISYHFNGLECTYLGAMPAFCLTFLASGLPSSLSLTYIHILDSYWHVADVKRKKDAWNSTYSNLNLLFRGKKGMPFLQPPTLLTSIAPLLFRRKDYQSNSIQSDTARFDLSCRFRKKIIEV